MGFQAEPGNQVKFPLRPPGGEGFGRELSRPVSVRGGYFAWLVEEMQG